jgi:hypothetical protein
MAAIRLIWRGRTVVTWRLSYLANDVAFGSNLGQDSLNLD